MSLSASACESGNGKLCTQLGVRYASGQGARVEPARAAALFEAGCYRGNIEGCLYFANSLYFGLGLPEDRSQAAKLYQRACEGGYPGSCTAWGLYYKRGEGVAKDETRAVQLFERSCRGLYAVGCGHLATAYFFGKGASQDYLLAHKLLVLACQLGNTNACENALVSTRRSAGDLSRRAIAFEGECKSGNAESCNNLAFIRKYSEEAGEVRSLWRSACERGQGEACYWLGRDQYEAKNTTLAAQSYRRACERGFAWGCHHLHSVEHPPHEQRRPGSLVAPPNMATVVFVRPEDATDDEPIYVFDEKFHAIALESQVPWNRGMPTGPVYPALGAGLRPKARVLSLAEPGDHTYYFASEKGQQLVQARLAAGRTYVVRADPARKRRLPVQVARTLSDSAKWLHATKRDGSWLYPSQRDFVEFRRLYGERVALYHVEPTAGQKFARGFGAFLLNASTAFADSLSGAAYDPSKGVAFPPPSPYSYYAPARVGVPAFPVEHDRLMSAAAAADRAWDALDPASRKALTIVPEDGLTAEEAAKMATR